MLQYVFLLVSDHFQKMSEQILFCADTHLSTFQPLFHALFTCQVNPFANILSLFSCTVFYQLAVERGGYFISF